ncbi:MAG: hypothetical protein JO347_06760, partial [Candidatus Eremiobacteraeota bacterium]|nr:hypothetical protein [Candidatus Eremiobacteraeota bacterium]
MLVIAVVVAFFVVRSARFHNYVLKTAEQKASAALNTSVRLQNFTVHLSTLSLDLYGLMVEGSGPGANKALLLADHGYLGLTVTSLWHREWYVRGITIDHPVVKLIVDQQGNTNLPHLPPSNGKSKSNVFDLGVQHLLLDRGEIYVNDRKEPLYADLHDLHFQSSYGTTDGGRYYGSLGYRNGHLQYGTYAPVTHDLQAQFDARRTGMSLSDVTLTTPLMVARLNAAIQNYSNPVAHATYSITLEAGELRRIIKNPSLPVGQVLVSGTADYTSRPDRPLLDTVALSGDVSSRELLVQTPQLSTTIRNLGAHYEVRNGSAAVRDLHAALLGGQITGQAALRDIAGNEAGSATLNVRNISLASLKSIAKTASLQQVSLRGEVNGKVDATWNGALQDVVARADAALSSTVAPVHTAAGSGPVPLNGVIHAIYNGNNQSLGFNDSYIKTPQSSLNLNGTLGKQSALKVDLQVNNLAELENVADTFRATKPGEPAPAPLGLTGKLSFNGTVTHSLSAPELQGHLSGSNVQVHGAAFKVLQANLDISPSHVAVTRGMIQPAGQGQMNIKLQAGLRDWSLTPDSPLQANVNARNIAIAPLLDAANVTMAVSGTLNANIDVHGSESNPIGRGNIALTNADISGQPIQAINLEFQGTGATVNSDLVVKTSAGNATAKLTYYPKTEGYDGVLQATGIRLAKLQAVNERNMGIAGTLSLTASGRGTLKEPQGQASLTIPELTV